MGDHIHPADYDIVLDVFGQRLAIIFTQISFFFPTEIEYSVEEIRVMLSPALNILATSFPWIAGQVVCEGPTSTSTGTFRIKPFEPVPRMAIKDLRDRPQVPSIQQWRHRRFPMKELDEQVFAPRNTSSGRPGETTAEVFQLQVSLIKGGAVITFLGQHQALDGIGLAQVISLFSKACLKVSFSEHELRVGNLAPENIVPLYDESWIPGPELQHNIVREASESGVGSPRTVYHSGSGGWSLFNITAESAHRLKRLASENLTAGLSFISTDDAITALMWQAITRARGAHVHPSSTVNLARAVDVRTALGISHDHPGFVQHMTYHHATAEELSSRQVSEVAAGLRAALQDRDKLAKDARSFTTMVSQTPDKTKTSYIAGFDMSKDLMLSSWSNQNSYELDFGFGKAEAVRRPSFPSFPGLVYLLPKAPNGDIAVAVCLNQSDMDRLRSDEIVQQFAAYIG